KRSKGSEHVRSRPIPILDHGLGSGLGRISFWNSQLRVFPILVARTLLLGTGIYPAKCLFPK
ncbi:MAG: hypothetical protein VXX55_08300, partial [Planctomycetota bacterium]|nr:hypothetical protein [Planctomycetota bacterium]